MLVSFAAYSGLIYWFSYCNADTQNLWRLKPKVVAPASAAAMKQNLRLANILIRRTLVDPSPFSAPKAAAEAAALAVPLVQRIRGQCDGGGIEKNCC